MVNAVIGVAGAMLLAWLMLVVALVIVRPRGDLLREALRLLPDVLRLLRRLAVDPSLPRATRLGPAFALVYLALPIDLIPDFIPVLGYADDSLEYVIGTIAVAFGAINIVGGFMVTDRMLGMFSRKPKPKPKADDDGGGGT